MVKIGVFIKKNIRKRIRFDIFITVFRTLNVHTGIIRNFRWINHLTNNNTVLNDDFKSFYQINFYELIIFTFCTFFFSFKREISFYELRKSRETGHRGRPTSMSS